MIEMINNVQLLAVDYLIFYVRRQSFDSKLIFLFLTQLIVIENDCFPISGLSFPTLMNGIKIIQEVLLSLLSPRLCSRSLFSLNGDLVCTTQSVCDTLGDPYLLHVLNSISIKLYIYHGKVSSCMS